MDRTSWMYIDDKIKFMKHCKYLVIKQSQHDDNETSNIRARPSCIDSFKAYFLLLALILRSPSTTR